MRAWDLVVKETVLGHVKTEQTPQVGPSGQCFPQPCHAPTGDWWWGFNEPTTLVCSINTSYHYFITPFGSHVSQAMSLS